MPDEPGSDLQAAANRAALEEQQRTQEPKKSLWGLLGIIALVVIVVLVLLMLKDCGRKDGADGAGGKTIEEVEGLEPMPGAVSAWVENKASLNGALDDASIDAGGVMDMGGGRYVISVPEGSEKRAVDDLKDAEGVYDAGLVYTQADDSKKAE